MIRRVALVVVFAAASAAPVLAADATDVAKGVTLLPGRMVPGVQPDGNTVVFRGTQGLVVFDTGRHPEHAQAILDFAKQSGLPVVAIVNSHWHLDHVGGNPMLRKAFPALRVYASGAMAGALTGFLADYRAQLEAMIATTPDREAQKPWRAEVALIDAGPALGPDEIVTASGPRALGGRSLDVMLETRAVTEGDVWLFDPATKVLASGDLVTLPVPFLDTACPARWKDALGRLAKVDFGVLVPGHGKPLSPAEFATYRTAFDRLLACASSQEPKGHCVDGWLRDAGPLLSGEDPKFVGGLVDYYVDLLRADGPRAAKLCGA